MDAIELGSTVTYASHWRHVLRDRGPVRIGTVVELCGRLAGVAWQDGPVEAVAVTNLETVEKASGNVSILRNPFASNELAETV